MGIEGPNLDREEPKATQHEEDSASQKRTVEEGSYGQEYSEIINSSITPYNILTFHDDVLSRLIKIVGRIVDKYKKNHPEAILSGKELEDGALKEEGLQDIHSVLESISKRKIDLNNIEEIIKSRIANASEVFVPPGEGGIIPGPGESFKGKELIPRLTTLMYLLENDLSVDLNNESEVQIVEGLVSDDMMRKHPYFRVSITEFDRVVYICEEEDNATFVFDKKELDSISVQVEELDVTNKATFNELIEIHPNIGVRIIQSKLWRANILKALANDFDQKQKSDFEPKEIIPKKKDGWESKQSLLSVCSASPKTIENFAEQFRLDHPEWFERQKNKAAIAVQYHPDLVHKIIEHFAAVTLRKDGWESSNSLFRKINTSTPPVIKKYAEQFRLKHPEWFERQKHPRGALTDYYHPALVAKIIEHYTSVSLRKSGWESASSLRQTKVADYSTIKKYAEQFRSEYPEWFEVQRIASGVLVEQYHPVLVEKIIEHFRKENK